MGIEMVTHNTSPTHNPPPSTDDEGIIPRNQTNTAYENWSCEDERDGKNGGNDNININTNTNSNNNNNETMEDVAWNIITIVLQGWFIIWLLFAIIVLTSEILSPQHSKKKAKKINNNAKAIVSVEDEQLFLEISEDIVSTCSYSNLDTEAGREECQTLCHHHMCCFINEHDEDAEFESHRYGCVNDPEKMCAAYAGCESLLVSEEDAIIYDADGVDVFGVGDATTADDTKNDGATTTTNKEGTPSEKISTIPATNYTTSSTELELIQQVITSVCSNTNLHTRHGMLECASLCNPSMCCFDPTDMNVLNPHMDLILKMEGIGNDVLDRTAMGSCLDEDNEGMEGDGGDDNDSTMKPSSHFCQVHAGCKNLLLVGAPPSVTTVKKRQPSSDPFIFTNVGFYDKDNQIPGNSVTSEQERTLETVTIVFGLLIALTVYLLVYKREAVAAIDLASLRSSCSSRMNNSSNADGRAHEQEMVDIPLFDRRRIV